MKRRILQSKQQAFQMERYSLDAVVRRHSGFVLDLSRQPKDKITSALHIYYEEVINSLVSKLRDEFENSRQLPKIDRPMPIVLSGGTARPRGFLQKFEAAIKSSGFPVQISDVRMASDPLTATARGCYIAAMSEIR